MDHDLCIDDTPQPGDGDRVEALLAFAFQGSAGDPGWPSLGAEELPHLGVARYRPIRKLGSGGMGQVLLAIDCELGREVAIKVLRQERQHDPVLLRRFLEEAQIAGQLQHPGVVPVYDLGVARGGEPFLVMKCVRGRTLAQLLRERAHADAERGALLASFVQVCQTMAYAHARGVIHRDLKPSNVMVGAFGEVQVMDWGLAKVMASLLGDAAVEVDTGEPPVQLAADPASTRSTPGSTLGTPAYMAPEQARGEHRGLDARSDVFSLGAILCEILTGSPPYAGANAAAVRERAAAGDLEAARQRLAGEREEPALAALASHCLQAAREARPADAGIVGATVQRILAGAAERAHHAELETAKAAAQAASERRSRRFAYSLLATLLLLGGVLLWQQQASAHQRSVTREAVVEALAEARSRAELAEAASQPAVVEWQAAVAAAERALAAVLAGSREPEVLQEVQSTLANLQGRLAVAEAALAARQQEGEWLDLLRDVRLSRDASEETPQRYVEAFARHGFNLERSDGELVDLLRGSGIREPLQLYLLRWGALARSDLRQRLRRLVLAAEDDPLRRRVLAAANRTELLALVPALAEDGSESSKQLLAMRLVDHQERAAGLRLLEQLIARHPQDVELRLAAANCHVLLHDPAAALTEARIAAALAPEGLKPEIAVTAALYAGRSPEAAEAMLRLVQRWSRKPEGLHPEAGMALLLAEMGCLDQAEPLMRRAIEHGCLHCDNAQTMGRRMLGAGRQEAALLAFRHALVTHTDGSSPASHLEDLGLLLVEMGRRDEALPIFMEQLRVEPGSAEAAYNVGICEGVRTGSVGALPWFELSARIDSRNGRRLGSLLQCYVSAGNLQLAETLYAEAAARLPGQAELHLGAGNAFLAAGRARDAEGCYWLASRIDPYSFVAWRGLELSATLAEDCAGARHAAAGVGALPADADWLCDIGIQLWRTHQPQQQQLALDLWEESAVARPSTRALAALRDMTAARKDYATALHASERLLQLTLDAKTIEKHWVLLRLMDRPDEAFEFALAHIAAAPESSHLQQELDEHAFQSYADTVRVTAAARGLLAGQRLSGDFLVHCSRWFNAEGDIRAVASTLRAAATDLPQDAMRLYGLAHALLSLGEVAAARGALLAIPTVTGEPGFRQLVASHAMQLGLPDLAARWFGSIPAQWLAEHEDLLAHLAEQFDATGTPKPGDAADVSAFGDPDDPQVRNAWCAYCYYRARYREQAESEYWLLQRPAVGSRLPWDAIQVADSLCQGAAAEPDAAVAARWRDQALRLLQQVLASDELERDVLQYLRECEDAASFAAVREPVLPTLSAGERSSWSGLWHTVDQRLRRGR